MIYPVESIIHLSNNPGLIQPLSWSCFSVDPTAWACIDNWSVSCQFIVLKLLCLVDIFVSFSLTSMPVNKLGIAKCTVNNIWKFWTFETLSEFTDNLIVSDWYWWFLQIDDLKCCYDRCSKILYWKWSKVFINNSVELNSCWILTWPEFTSNVKWQVNGYECVCAPGFSGLQCDIPSQVCGANVCQNGAKCVVQPPDFICECPSGYGGKFCEMKIDHCASSPCHNYATCKSLAEGYQCSCRPGYEGVQCERDSDECASDPCQNNGTCIDGDNRYTCTCKAGFTGMQCETSINECLLEPCHNGGQCVDKENGFECICKPTYSGDTCTKSKTACTTDFRGLVNTSNMAY